ncbi:hypothetical protein CSB45_14385 [candidate division KSB3 bacterium]|uniref:Uncharacterized protein n=1 Tax=candidate division KSB3 bacterium TaxID=2044937 RepID=A0A2G6E1F5_9BACT|nr:MAG: hypothetical protein CSB45_14385 [candidate division KSB3 bacterium]PIE30342.1 MAG: hypothetical protein CSA57_03385 [candidate division KSB3 bacterium]
MSAVLNIIEFLESFQQCDSLLYTFKILVFSLQTNFKGRRQGIVFQPLEDIFMSLQALPERFQSCFRRDKLHRIY